MARRRRILLGVSGGIAAYKALELVRLATAAGHAVRVVQTPASQRFIGAASFAALTGAPVLVDEFERDPARGAFPGDPQPDHDPLSHLELAANADIYVIAPASANTVAKLAAGLADNLLTSAALAATCPLLVAPAMNNHMWAHPATQDNVALLRARGVTVLEPPTGRLASTGEQGAGRLPEPRALLEAVEALTRPPLAAPSADLVGLRVLVTAGGTREPIDAVRFVGNRSSGRMGFALAAAAADLGAAVTVVAANVALPRDPRVAYVDVETAAELQDACAAAFGEADVLLMAAAVADFRPAASLAGKLKKAGEERLRVELERTPDILTGLAAVRRPDQTLVGFAAEHGDGALAYAREKLAHKGLDAIVVNDVARADIGFDAVHNEVTILTAGGETHVARASKAHVARAVLDVVAGLREPTAEAAGPAS
ncbi:MAG: Phosphopantothenoylcysteine decarboxylase / Phosphopantothenoylcysteine synthetase [uncultured Solirubrobacteraceae bacterium]|uniref:Coenzyme A biosynthesis bifunctional protein CoaBC n=1 Tax=uncultured Solirubrobacteraceae bacterium TaxID=1162706 RepID=A0A6J4SW85_9ACTN|nr:MAG: Phosphopantothenoylcysteine decarboxylase / Phosphopantothenoylcysteine synthetase [uncultured Solirubrobacteraceae bacterium]